MWFWPRGQTLSDEQIKEVKRKATSVRRAYSSCLKCNSSRPEACRGLEVRLLESYAQHCCQEQADAFRACYSSVFETDQDPAVCEPYIKAMQKCLKRKGLVHPLM